MTLTVSTENSRGRPGNRGPQYGLQSDTYSGLVISAVRVLVGTNSTENIPKALRIMGSVVKLKPGEKRWYSIHLSPQDTAFSLRNGFVTIGVDQCFDSSNSPILDAMEIYAVKREEIEHWLPVSLRSLAASVAVADTDSDNLAVVPTIDHESFRLGLTALTNLHTILGSSKPNNAEEAFLRQLVQDTALEKDPRIDLGISRLVASFKQNEDTRQSFVDKAVLLGCAAFLRKCQQTLDTCELDKNTTELLRVWHSFTPSLRTCLQTAARVARLRPFNYLQAVEEEPKSCESVAADACTLVIAYLAGSLASDDLVSDLVELSLLEIAVANGRPRGRFGSFDGLRSLLSSQSSIVVGQTCASISRFCRECDIFHALTKAVQYVCDSCLVLIEDTRYTSLEDAEPFDLCTDCYRLGNEYISRTKCDDAANVVIKGKSIGAAHRLTCGEVKRMQGVATEKKPGTEAGASEGESSNTSRGGALVDPYVAHRRLLFNDFMDVLISGIAKLLGDRLQKRNDRAPESLVWLSVECIRHSFQSGRKLERAKKLANALATGLSYRIEDSEEQGGSLVQCILFLEGLNCLVLPSRSGREYLVETQTNVVPDVEPSHGSAGIVCERHGAPVKMQKFTEGPDTDRPFFCCSMDKKSRCNFFLWTDKGENQQTASLFIDDIAKVVWELLTQPPADSSSESPLHLMLATFIKRFSSQSLCEGKLAGATAGHVIRGAGRNLRREFADGVFCSRDRLQDDSVEETLVALDQRSTESETDVASHEDGLVVVEKSLELLALIASPGRDKKYTTVWFPILCRLLLLNKNQAPNSDKISILARASLRQLCGKLWRPVRDHCAFALQFENMIVSAEFILKYCVILKEKARQCGSTWRTSEMQGFTGLSIGDLAGTEGLISEDIATLRLNEELGKILGEVWASATKRAESWKRFCGLRSFQTESPAPIANKALDFSLASPIMLLFTLAGSLSADNQAKALRLINAGLSQSNDRKPASQKSGDKEKPTSSDDEEESDDAHGRNELFGLLGAQGAAPVEITGVSGDDLHAFVMRFVCRGQTSEIRSLSCKVALRLCHALQKPALGRLVGRLMLDPLSHSGTAGKRAADFLSFLQSLVKLAGPASINVGVLAAQVQSHFKQQMLALQHDRANGEFLHFETRSSASVQKKRFDLASCVSCCLHVPKAKEKHGEKSTPATGSNAAQGSRSAVSGSSPRTKWAPQQVSPFIRGRLHAGRDSCVSNEFNTFHSLKNRCAISEIHVEVENPRRHVKTIKFYFSPRPVDDPSILKSGAYAGNWQLCGSLSLARGSTRATLTISTPVIAANLKIEYTDFYEAGSTRSSDGTLVILCPRCTRAVTNAHGVCSNCGEVAFQCRKCRHINYDRLDAFLCVECGYCASATLQFELTAGVASNAIAITNDDEYEKTVRMATLASRLHRDLRAALKLKLATLVRSSKKKSAIGDAENLNKIESIQRAFESSLPTDAGDADDALDFTKLTLSQLGKAGSVVKMMARPNALGESSMFRLARRAERSTGGGRSESLMIQGLRVDEVDETASELLGGLLESSGSLSRFAGLDPGDPLSQLLASVQSRRERQNTEDRDQGALGGGGAEPAAAGTKKAAQNNAKETVDECDRLFELMREAEREAYELERRCVAWRRLNTGQLAEIGSEQQQQQVKFEPSHCSACAATISVQMLVLWLRLFQLDPDSVVVKQDMISLLLNDKANFHLKNLQDTKKAAVKEIAIRSKQGRPLVLDALRARLTLTQDVNSAEIVGKILETVGSDAEVAAPFVALAREALESNTS